MFSLEFLGLVATAPTFTQFFLFCSIRHMQDAGIMLAAFQFFRHMHDAAGSGQVSLCVII